MDRILDLYRNMNAPISEIDVTTLDNVDIDNVCYELNKTFGGFFSYNTEIITGAFQMLKVTLYTPVKAITGYAKIDMNSYDMDVLTRTALVNAVRMGFDFRAQVPTNLLAEPGQTFNNDKVAATTLKDIEELEKEIASSIENQEPKEIKVEDNGVVEFKPDPPNNTNNKFGIREDQIEFMKQFQEKYKIDTAEKFDTYVTAWGHQQSMYVVSTKKQLIGFGPDAVDSFIAWVKEVNRENAEFIEPTDKEWEECCK